MIRHSWTEQADARLADTTQFDSWFDAATSRKEAIANGTIDFYHRILTPDLYPLLGDPRNKTCLEVGYGGGRLLNAALNVFERGYGIDILSDAAVKVVGDRLQATHGDIVTLVDRDNVADIPSQSVDFVYSFIVFQHFDGLDEVKRYFSVFSRVMKPGAVGKVFYRSGCATVLDAGIFQDNPRAETLTVSVDDMKHIVTTSSLETVSNVPIGPKKVWNPTGPQSSQAAITFTKRRQQGVPHDDW
jgi:SAM-dependent methyltransferase